MSAWHEALASTTVHVERGDSGRSLCGAASGERTHEVAAATCVACLAAAVAQARRS